MTTFRDALRLQRLNVMRQRRAAMAAVKARATCACAVCTLRRGGGNPLAALFGALGGEPDDPPIQAPSSRGTH